MSDSLTERQTQILAFIRDFLGQHQRPPTLREIGRALAIRSTNGVRKQLIALEEKGHITRTPGQSRGIEIVRSARVNRRFAEAGRSEDRHELRAVPLLSKEAHSRFPNRLLDPSPRTFGIDPALHAGRSGASLLFARAGDNGMESGGVLYGDLVLVKQVPVRELDEGELVAALVGKTLVVRHFFVEDGNIRLSAGLRPGGAGSPTVPDISFVPGSPDGLVLGRVRLVMRTI